MKQEQEKAMENENPMSYETFLDCLEKFASLGEFGEAQKFLHKYPEHMKRCSMELDKEREAAEKCGLFANLDTAEFYRKLMERDARWMKK